MAAFSPTQEDIRHSVTKSKKAFSALVKGLEHPRIKLDVRRNVPLFFADPDTPGIIIRKLNGKTQRGTMHGDRFVATR